MRSVEQVEVVAARGIVGDRYEGAKHRQVSIQSLTAIGEASEVFGSPIDPALTRRNITVSAGEIPKAPGSLIRIGDLLLEVVRVAAPCKLLDDTIGLPCHAMLWLTEALLCAVALPAASASVAASPGAKSRERKPRRAEMFGYTREEMYGRPSVEVFPSPEAYAAFGREAGPLLHHLMFYIQLVVTGH
eukprot:gene35373-40016_t